MCAWSVSANVDEFDEAISWFRTRVPYTTAQLDGLEDSARARAFTIAGHLELESVQTIFDEIDHSIAKGTPFEEFQKRVAEKLDGKMGPDGYHLETVFRNNVQTAYNTGRWYQLMDPELLQLRPMIMLDAVLDSRTSEICTALDGTIKPATDPFWLRCWPPLHHRCRTSPRSLRMKEAERRGITPGDPDIHIDDGFGVAPPLRGDEIPEPKATRFDSDLWRAYGTRKVKAGEELAAAQVAVNAKRLERDQRDPAWWFENKYREQYGEAGRAVAWGKAMEHRGLAMSGKKALAEHGKLVRAGAAEAPMAKESIETVLRAQGHKGEALKEAFGKTPLRDLVVFAEDNDHLTEAANIRGVAALAGHGSSIERMAKGTIEFHDIIPLPGALQTEAELESAAKGMAKFFEAIADASVKQPRGVVLYSNNDPRGSYDGLSKELIAGKGELADMVHEWGHALDNANEGMADRASEFLARRTLGEAEEPLLSLTNNDEQFHPLEMTRKDGFYKVYMGKSYHTGLTEVTTMSLQALVDQPAWLLADVDPDTLYFALGQLAGDKLP